MTDGSTDFHPDDGPIELDDPEPLAPPPEETATLWAGLYGDGKLLGDPVAVIFTTITDYGPGPNDPIVGYTPIDPSWLVVVVTADPEGTEPLWSWQLPQPVLATIHVDNPPASNPSPSSQLPFDRPPES